MTWFTAQSVSVTNNQTIVSVVNATSDDIAIAQEAGGLVIGTNPPVEIKRTYLDGSGNKRIELRQPWPYANQSGQPAVAFPTDADLAEATRVLRAVGSDAVTFAEALAQVLSSTAPTITIQTETSGPVTVVPYGRLNQQVQTLLNTFGDFGVPLYDTDTKNQARTLLGLQPQIIAQPTIDFDFTSNQYLVYEPFGLTRKTLVEAITTARNSAASYNSPFGVAQAAANIPRIEYDPATGECLGLLCEEARTNLLLHSVYTAANNTTPPTSWSLQAVTGTTTTEASPRVSGATRSRHSGTNQRAYYQQTLAVAANTTYTLSAFFAADTSATNQVLGIGGIPTGTTGKTFLSGSEVVPNAVNSMTFTTGTESGSIQVRIGLGCFADATGTVIHETPQLEVGSFPTSYIKTEGSQVTRSADQSVTAIPPALDGLTVVLDASFIGSLLTPCLFKVGSTTDVFGQGLAFDFLENQIRIRARTSSFNTATVIANSSNGIFAMRLAANGVSFFTAGALIGSFTLTTAQFSELVSILKVIRIGPQLAVNGSASNFGKITVRGVSYIPRALSDQELIDLTRL